MNNESRNLLRLDRTQKLYLTLLVLAASVLASTLVVIYNNSTRTFSIFIFFLFLGVGTMLAVGLVRGVLVGLLLIATWIAVKQLLGIWDENRLLDHLLELIIVGLTFIFGGIYHDHLQGLLNRYRRAQDQLRQLELEDKRVGLIKPAIGLLRLQEEEERSIRYRRPCALILMRVRSIPGMEWDQKEETELMRAVATGVKDTTRETDVPFLAEKNQIAVILPETDSSGANRVLNNIFSRMIETQFVTPDGHSMSIQKGIQLRFGFAAFLGTGSSKINMMEAAEKSLQRSLEINSDDLFQNLFIEWVTIGEPALSVPLFEKASS